MSIVERSEKAAVVLAAALSLVAGCSLSTGRSATEGSNGIGRYDLVVVTRDLSAGRNYLALAVRGSDGTFRGGAESTATIAIRFAGDVVGEVPGYGKESYTVEAPFVGGATSGPGFYATRMTFASAGEWEVSASFVNPAAGGLPDGPLTARVVVADRSQAPAPGEPAPRSRTKTLASVGGDFSKLTSDPHPDPDLYAASLDGVIGSGRPVVVMFATPLRCQSALCGPAIERLKEARSMDPEAHYIHVDVFEKPLDTSDDTYASAVREWRLPTEPVTFVLTPDGRIYDRFEGMFLPGQLAESLAEARSAH